MGKFNKDARSRKTVRYRNAIPPECQKPKFLTTEFVEKFKVKEDTDV